MQRLSLPLHSATRSSCAPICSTAALCLRCGYFSETFLDNNYGVQTLYKDIAERALLMRERFFQHLRRRFLMMQKTEQLLDSHMVGLLYCNTP